MTRDTFRAALIALLDDAGVPTQDLAGSGLTRTLSILERVRVLVEERDRARNAEAATHSAHVALLARAARLHDRLERIIRTDGEPVAVVDDEAR